jgi:hypothetical protein
MLLEEGITLEKSLRSLSLAAFVYDSLIEKDSLYLEKEVK